MNLIEEFHKRSKIAGFKITPLRLALVEELTKTRDHPTAEKLLERMRRKYPRYTTASIYRTLNVLERLKLIVRHDFNEGAARIEAATGEHHNHLIDIESGDIVEFTGKRIEALQHEIAEKLGYELIDFKLEIYARPKGKVAEDDGVLRKRKSATTVMRA